MRQSAKKRKKKQLNIDQTNEYDKISMTIHSILLLKTLDPGLYSTFDPHCTIIIT